MDGIAGLKTNPILDGLTVHLHNAVAAADTYKSAIHSRVSKILAPTGKVDRTAFAANQHRSLA